MGQPIMLEPFLRKAIIKTPIMDPRMLPDPPLKLPPPITTAAMISETAVEKQSAAVHGTTGPNVADPPFA